MDSNAPLVSVVTPFYNTADFLPECIESVLRQTYCNWEYVLVNNCSTDESVRIVEDYIRRYPGKIRLEHNSAFVPRLQNFNGAFRVVNPKSKYCKVVLADDFLFPQCLELMVAAAEKDPCVGVVGSYALEGRDVAFDGLPYPSPVMPGRDACRFFFLENRYLFGSPSQLLLRSDLVSARQPFYDLALDPFADAAAIFDVLEKWKFGFVHQVLTFSRRDNSSVMKSLMDMDCQGAFQLLMLRQYGRKYLDANEYRERLTTKEKAYAHLLVVSAVGMRGKAFRQFHREMRKRMGYTFASLHTWWLFFLASCDAVFNPKRSLRLFLNGIRHSN
jgi:glycosyltransferase involved in cell wall biosynthesis